MLAVFIMSYLFAAVCGAAVFAFSFLHFINKWEHEQASANLHADNAKNLKRDDLSVGNLY